MSGERGPLYMENEIHGDKYIFFWYGGEAIKKDQESCDSKQLFLNEKDGIKNLLNCDS